MKIYELIHLRARKYFRNEHPPPTTHPHIHHPPTPIPTWLPPHPRSSHDIHRLGVRQGARIVAQQMTYSIVSRAIRHRTISLGILQNMVNPSLAPTQPEGSELPTISYRGEGIPRVLKQYRFSPYGYIFPIREVINSYMHHWPGSQLTQVMA